MEIICERRWGEPKLKKPKFLNNKTLLGSVKFFKCSCKLWKVEDDYYLLMRDWFSNCISLAKAVELGIIDRYNKKFVYNDNFGSVVLRNEAIIKFNRNDWLTPYTSSATNLCCKLEKLLGLKPTELWTYGWENMFEQCIKLAGYNDLDVQT